MRNREENIAAACSIDGWLTKREASTLYDMAFNADGPIIEIGSWQGRSTAALALGSIAGRGQTVYSIDPFIGPQEGARKTSLENIPDTTKCSPQILRSNLVNVGVNGQVEIIPKYSHEALEDVPGQCSLLFVDGAHDYESVCKDLDLYLPRLKLGGFVVLHDVIFTDPGVVKAVDDKILAFPNALRVIDRVDSALVIRRVETKRRNIGLMCPGRGYDWGTVSGIVQCTLGAHRVDLDNNANGWDDFNALWARALNRYESGEITHIAMLHSDITPQAGFIDILMDEMEESDVDMISVACPLKDRRGVLNCGIGITSNRWGAWRRLTMRELVKLPPTFSLNDLKKRGYCGASHDDKVLLHNTGCFIVDLRKPVFRKTDSNNDLVAWFDFPTRIRRDGPSGKWINMRESEDWFFSRQLHQLEANTRITRKVTLTHEGKGEYPNNEVWGTYENGDEDTKELWKEEVESD